MSGEVSRAGFDAAFAESAAAAAFGRGPRRVTEADQAVARAFDRKVPPLTEASEGAMTPEAEMEALLKEFRELRVSRRGDPTASANAAGIRERAAIVDHLKGAIEGKVVVRDRQALARLRMRVEEMRAELPLSAAAETTTSPHRVSVDEFDRAFERRVADGRQYTQAEAEEAVAAAFGRSTKGQA